MVGDEGYTPGAIAAFLNSKYLMVKTKQAGGKSNSSICSLAEQLPTEGNDLMKRPA